MVTGVSIGTTNIIVTTEEGSFTDNSAVTVVPTQNLVIADYDLVTPTIIMIEPGRTQMFGANNAVSSAGNPSQTNNPSANSGKFEKSASSWSNFGFLLSSGIPVGEYNAIKFKIYGPNVTEVYVKLVDHLDEVFQEGMLTGSYNETWGEFNLSFDSNKYLKRIEIFPNPNSTTASSYYVDDVILNSKSSNNNGNISVTGIALDPNSASIVSGSSRQITANVSPVNASNKAVTWTSSNSAVATVNGSGQVTGVAVGTAIITATTQNGGFTATSNISVTPQQDKIIADYDVVVPTITNIEPGKTQMYGAGNAVAMVSNPSSSNNGSANVGKFDKSANSWQNFGFNVSTPMALGEFKDLTFQLYGPNVTEVYVKLEDASNNVLAEGNITGTFNNQWGRFTLPFNVSGSFKYINIFANQTAAVAASFYVDNVVLSAKTPTINVSATGVTLNTNTATLNIGATNQLTATVNPSDATDKTVTWLSSNTAIATVNNTGLVTAVSAGNATVTVTTNNGGHTATCSVTVNANPPANVSATGVTLSTNTATLNIGATNQLTATVNPSDATDKTVTWSSSNTAVATVNSTGLVTAVSAGNATVTVTTNNGGHMATCSVTVNANPPANVSATGVTLNTNAATLNIGATNQLTATVNPSDATDKTVTWSSSNTAIATVNNTGLVTAVSAGNATITVTTNNGGHTATCSVTVNANPPANVSATGVTLNTNAATLNIGATNHLTATVNPSDATDKTVTWSSSNTAVATVNSTGLVTAVASGNATVTVTTNNGGHTAVCSVTVNANPNIDNEAPTKPLNLVSTSQYSMSIALKWDASSDNVGVRGYEIYSNAVKVATTTGLTFNMIGLTQSTTYSFQVAAFDRAGNVSEMSSLLSVETKSATDNQSPSEPQNLVSNSQSTTTISLSWDNSTDNIGVKGYDVYSQGVKIGSPTGNYFEVANLEANTEYNFQVVAFDFSNNHSSESETLIAKTKPLSDTQAPTAPSGLSSPIQTANSLSLEWVASTDNDMVMGYLVYRDGQVAGSSAGTNFVVAGLMESTDFIFTVKAFDRFGNISASSNVLTAKTLGVIDMQAPSIPANLVSNDQTANSVRIQWDASVDNNAVKGYVVYIDGQTIGSTMGINFVFTELLPNSTYNFTVRAFDYFNNFSAASNILPVSTSGTNDTEAPTAPSNLVATNRSNTQIELEWDSSFDNIRVKGYQVFRDGSLIGSLTGHVFTSTGLIAATEYTYKVRAFDAAGNFSEFSNEATEKTSDNVPSTIKPRKVFSISLDNTWEIDGIENFPNATIKLYNRWGTKVFEASTSANSNWNGTYNGQQLNEGVFTYVIHKSGSDKSPLTGTVLLVR